MRVCRLFHPFAPVFARLGHDPAASAPLLVQLCHTDSGQAASKAFSLLDLPQFHGSGRRGANVAEIWREYGEMKQSWQKLALMAVLCGALSACGGQRQGLFGGQTVTTDQRLEQNNPNRLETENTIWSVFNRRASENTVQVNRYIWNASLEVLDFLPVQTIDPFTGVIVTGFGTPPGGGRSYRATILIDDPALDARSLNVALQTRGGTADPATVRAIEDAILTRARQLRGQDSRL